MNHVYMEILLSIVKLATYQKKEYMKQQPIAAFAKINIMTMVTLNNVNLAITNGLLIL